MKIQVGIYGENGHQIHNNLENHPLGQLVATAAFSDEKLPASLKGDSSITRHATLDELLRDPRVQLVSLCSPRRADQAKDAIQCLRAGKHVYAEKPCGLSEAEIDEILAVAKETGLYFREMAGTVFGQPYYAMRKIVKSGCLGDIVQVICEKSYPYGDWRPQDEALDGGLILQNAVHATRFIEQVAWMKIKSAYAMETLRGNPVPGGGLRIASSIIMGLENGGVATVSANYLNPRGTGVWGNESLKIMGTLGFIESTQGGQQTRLVIGEKNLGPIDVSEQPTDYLDSYLKTLLGQGDMPVTLDEELSPTRWVIRAKKNLVG